MGPDLADGTRILATSTEVTIWVRNSTDPVPRPKELSLGVMCAIGGATCLAVLTLGVMWLARVGLI